MNVKPPSLVPQRTSFPRMSRLRRVLTVFLIAMARLRHSGRGVAEGWMIAGKPTRQVRSRGRHNSALRRPAERLPEVEGASDGRRAGRNSRSYWTCLRMRPGYFLGSCLTVREHLAQRSEIRSCGRRCVDNWYSTQSPGVRPGRSGFSAAIKSAIQAVIRSAGLQ